jgi:hypothetical protein
MMHFARAKDPKIERTEVRRTLDPGHQITKSSLKIPCRPARSLPTLRSPIRRHHPELLIYACIGKESAKTCAQDFTAFAM